MRERLAEHRANAACASCHNLMDPVGFALENFDAVGRWRTVEEGKPIDASGGLARRQQVRRRRRARSRRCCKRPELFVGTLTEKLLTFALGRGVEYYDAPAVRKIVRDAQRDRLPLLVDHSGNRQQHAVSDEEVAMIITKKALPRRTFLRGVGATLALPLLDAMVPAVTALAKTPANPVRRLGFVFMPMGCDITRWTPPGEDTLDELSPILSSLAPVKDQVTVITNLELQNAYPGTHATSNAAFLSAAKAKRTESTDYYLGTTVDQIAAQQIGQETQLPSLELSMDLLQIGRPVRQRLRLRLSEQPLVVVADDAAAGRGASAHRVRAPVRRRRQRGRTARRAAQDAPACSTAFSDDIARLQTQARPGRSRAGSASISTPSARSSGASRRPRPTRRTIRCRISIGRSACRPPMPTTRG